MIVETKVAFADIAKRTGFGSIRQFNHSVRAAFGQSPTKLRLDQKVSVAAGHGTRIVVHLHYRHPFDWPSLIEFFKARATPGVEQVENDFYRRTVEMEGRVGMIEVWQEPNSSRLSMRLTGLGCDCLLQIVQRVRRMFDLEADITHIARHLSKDAKLAKMLAQRPGLRVPGAWDGFEIAVRAVLGQQLGKVDEPALAGRIVQAFGQPVQTGIPALSHSFPGAAVLAEADLQHVGVMAEPAETIRSLARAVLAGKLAFNSSKGLRDTLSRLQANLGLNQGLASYIAMRSYGEPDALPHTDPGLRRALAIHGKPVSPAEVLRAFEKFKPWRAYAAIHLNAATPKIRK